MRSQTQKQQSTWVWVSPKEYAWGQLLSTWRVFPVLASVIVACVFAAGDQLAQIPVTLSAGVMVVLIGDKKLKTPLALLLSLIVVANFVLSYTITEPPWEIIYAITLGLFNCILIYLVIGKPWATNGK